MQKVNENNRKVWVKNFGNYVEEIGQLSFNKINLSVQFGYTYYNKGEPYGIVLYSPFKTVYTYAIQPCCTGSILTATPTDVDLTSSTKVLKYWLSSAKSGTLNLTINYKIIGNI